MALAITPAAIIIDKIVDPITKVLSTPSTFPFLDYNEFIEKMEENEAKRKNEPIPPSM